MNSLKLLISFFIIIVLLFLIRIMIYNNYRKRIENTIEPFQSEINSKLPSLMTLVNKSAVIYSNVLGEISFIFNDKLIVFKNNKLSSHNLKDFLKLKNNIKLGGGFYDHLANCLFLFENNTLLIYSFKFSKVIEKTTVTSYFKLKEPINKAIVYKHLIVFFKEDKSNKIDKANKADNEIILFDKNTNNITTSKEIEILFKKLPKNFNGCFNNFLDLHYKIPLPTPTFIKNGEVFTIDLKTNKVKGPRNLKLGILSNTKSILISDSNLSLKVNESGHYRVYLFGAGMPTGGFGGLIFNDFYIKKSHNLGIVTGKMGKRIPVKSENDNKLEQVYNISLPFNVSCSGSGGTFLVINNELQMAVGGGGGWSSEQIIAPSFCNSKPFSKDITTNTPIIPKHVLPIKKIIIVSQPTSKNNIRYKIVVSELQVEVSNMDYLSYDVNESPRQHEQSLNYIYETSYSEMNGYSQIEITFNQPISDYKIKLNYDILATDNVDFINSKVIIIDEQYRKYVMHNFNMLFNYKYITCDNVYSFLRRQFTDTKELVKNTKFVTNGIGIVDNLNDLLDHDKAFKQYNFNPNEGDNRFIGLNGGLGGGGHSLANRQLNDIVASGGGGYKGGKTIISLEKDNIDYAGGSGGTSFIKNINYDQDWSEYLYVNDFNGDKGYAILQKIEKRIDENEFNDNADNANDANNADANNTNNANNADNANFKFFNNTAETFLSKNSHLLNVNNSLRNNFANALNHNKNIEFNEEDIKTSKNIAVLKIVNDSLHINNIVYGIKASEPFNLMIISWNEQLYERSIMSINKESLPDIIDDISHLNHGYSRLTKSKMRKYNELLMENDVYKHSNSVTKKNLINNINSLSVYKLFSLQNYYNLSENKRINLDSFSTNTHSGNIKIPKNSNIIYLVIKFDTNVSGKNKTIRMVSTKYNSQYEETNSMLERNNLYL